MGLARDALDRAKARRAASTRRTLILTAVTTILVLLFVTAFWGRGLFLGAPRLPPSSLAVAPAESSPPAPIGPAQVRITLDAVKLDGVVVDDPRPLADEGRLRRLEGLFAALRARRDTSPDAVRSVVMDVDHDVPAVVVKSAFQTAAYAGYPNVSFVTKSDAHP